MSQSPKAEVRAFNVPATPIEHQSQRQSLLGEAKAIAKRAEADKRSLTEDENRRIDECLTAVKKLDDTYRSHQRIREFDAIDDQPAGRRVPSDALIGMTERDVRRYSISRAI